MSLNRRFKCYVNVAATEKKITRLLPEFHFLTFAELAEQYTQSRACLTNPVQPVMAAVL